MKVTHFISSLDTRGGGPSVALEGLTKAQVACGMEVSVVATLRPGEDLERVERMRNAGTHVTTIGPVNGPLSRHPDLIHEVVKSIGTTNVAHLHGMWEQVQHLAARSAYTAKVPYFIRPCGMLDPWSLRQSRYRKKLFLFLRVRKNLNRAAAMHFTTSTERDLAAPLRLRPPSIVEPNGVGFSEEGSFSSQDLRERFNLGPGPIALFFSRLHPKKGIDVLIDAFERVIKRWDATAMPHPTLLLAGPDEAGTQAKIESRLSALSCRPFVKFTGLLEGKDKQMALQGSDLFVLPSHQENFGIAVVEALAEGTPVLISDQVNIYSEIVDAGVGEATPVDAAQFADALTAWLTDKARREAAARKAAAWARSSYDWSRIAKRWTTVHYPAYS